MVCTNKLTTGTLEVQKGGMMRGNIEHNFGGELSLQTVRYCIPINTATATSGAAHNRRRSLYDSALSRNESHDR
ncbi:hypothetical protein MJ391_21560 [Escherichia coli]|nr:hypothetical protein MJ391_21560 [Escherichia coli]